ncbi:MAG TPA: helix-turn-helix domain-containing protein [Ktedonobacterales bacterium]|nr:helix-turn-helix domain-containing protein [Ktedonobacterales bacterium]
MGYSPAFDTVDTTEALLDRHAVLAHSRARHEVLRFGGLGFDPRTGAANWRGKTLALAVQDREVLGVLMHRAGQIVSRQSLTSLLGVPAERLERRMLQLREALKAAGVSCLPVNVDGLGYVLWRC